MFRTRPFTQFQLTSEPEGAKRFHAAVTKYKLDDKFVPLTLNQKDGRRAVNHISDVAIAYGYGHFLSSFPQTMLPLTAAQVGTSVRQQTIDNTANILTNYNRLDVETGRAHANTYFGDGAFLSPGVVDQIVVDFDNVAGDIHPAAHANVALRGTLTPQGQTAYMNRVHSEYAACHLWTALSEDARRYLRNHRYFYEWTDPITGEIYRDGPTMILLCLHRLRPDTVIDTYKKIESLKAIRLVDFDLDFNRMIDTVNEKKDEITDIDANAYPDTAYAADLFRLMSEGAPEAMKTWVNTEHMKWATGETVFDNFLLQQRATRVFTNLTSAGRWKKSFDQKDQIIALSTEIKELKSRIEENSDGAAPPLAAAAAFAAETGKSFQRKGKIKMEAWRLVKKGAEVTHDGRKWYWCTEPHFDNGVKKPMYVTHLPGEHSFWKDFNACKDSDEKTKMMDERNAKRDKMGAGGGKTATKKKIVLDPSLTTKLSEAFCAQSGMSESQVNAIFESFDPK